MVCAGVEGAGTEPCEVRAKSGWVIGEGKRDAGGFESWHAIRFGFLPSEKR